jgi:tetratricopeptide (TPR) repeat protein
VVRFAHSDLPLREIAEDLSADALAFGSLLEMGEHVQLSMELTDPATGENLWANSYSSAVEALPALTNRIARELAQETSVDVSPENVTRLSAAGRVNPEAFNEYVLGKHQAERYTRVSFRRAVEHFSRAVELDATFSPGWAGLGYAYVIAAWYGFVASGDAYDHAQAAIDTALALDSESGLAYMALAWLVRDRDWDWAAAEQAYLRAIELSPTSEAYECYGWFLSTYMGRFDEAVRALERAVEIDPTSPLMHLDLAWMLEEQGDLDRAVTHLDIATELDSMYPEVWLARAEVHMHGGQFDDALAAMDRYEALGGEAFPGRRGHLYALMGRRESALAELERWTDSDAFYLAAAYIRVGLGERDTAISLLEQATAQRIFWGWYGWRWDPLRDDPRFQALLQRVGVVEP